MELLDYAQYVLALIFVLALVGLGAWALRYFGVSGNMGTRRDSRLAVVEATMVDKKHRLLLVRRDNVEHLLLIGGSQDVVVESGIRRDAQRPAAEAPRLRQPPVQNRAAAQQPPHPHQAPQQPAAQQPRQVARPPVQPQQGEPPRHPRSAPRQAPVPQHAERRPAPPPEAPTPQPAPHTPHDQEYVQVPVEPDDMVQHRPAAQPHQAQTHQEQVSAPSRPYPQTTRPAPEDDPDAVLFDDTDGHEPPRSAGQRS